jgi:hypothetical protein
MPIPISRTEMLQEQLKTDSNFQLNAKQKKLSERVEYEEEVSKNNSKRVNDEL